MENAQLQLIYLLKVVIFTSYVSFPEGTLRIGTLLTFFGRSLLSGECLRPTGPSAWGEKFTCGRCRRAKANASEVIS